MGGGGDSCRVRSLIRAFQKGLIPHGSYWPCLPPHSQKLAHYLCADSQNIWIPNPGISIPTAHKELKIQESRHQPPHGPHLTATEAAPDPLTQDFQHRKTGRRFQMPSGFESFAKTYRFYLLQTASLFLASPSGHRPCSDHRQGLHRGLCLTSVP